MNYISTRGESPGVDFKTALFQGLAEDGGLYLPERVPRLSSRFMETFREKNFIDMSAAIAASWLEEIPPQEISSLMAEALNFEIPLVELEEGVWILELFHGPTLAFKDVGARFMARLMERFLEGENLTILAATSGDTGSAVAQAFQNLPGIRVVVLYPKGKVSVIQEKQFATLGGNVTAAAVRGVFDDCQRMVKEAFTDKEFRIRHRLTSANSINLGRLLPQSFYYFWAASQLPPGSPPPLFSIPSGNFGNLCAGILAKKMGLPVSGFVAATNVNDIVPEYLRTANYQPRPSIPTISNAMDVGSPSNFERILHLYDGDAQAVRGDLTGSSWSDEETRRAIRQVFEKTGRVLDPHTAVGWLGQRQALSRWDNPPPAVLLATAHPAKFPEAVEPVIGRKISPPPRLAACLDRRTEAVEIPPSISALRELLED